MAYPQGGSKRLSGELRGCGHKGLALAAAVQVLREIDPCYPLVFISQRAEIASCLRVSKSPAQFHLPSVYKKARLAYLWREFSLLCAGRLVAARTPTPHEGDTVLKEVSWMAESKSGAYVATICRQESQA
ncbi:MAG TPA: hypothetical protein VGE93_21300 [Bryobacteraceae bacterium]